VLTAVYVFAWLRALLVTQLVEAPIYRRTLAISWWRALVPSFVTHPFVWFVFPRMSDLGVPYAAWVAVAEGAVWLVEAVLLARLARVTWMRAALVSLLGNGASLGLGLVLNAALGGI
jgi:hypothetical protein